MKAMYVESTCTKPVTDKLYTLTMSEWISGVEQGILTGEGTVKLTCTDVHAGMFVLGSGALCMGLVCSSW